MTKKKMKSNKCWNFLGIRVNWARRSFALWPRTTTKSYAAGSNPSSRPILSIVAGWVGPSLHINMYNGRFGRKTDESIMFYCLVFGWFGGRNISVRGNLSGRKRRDNKTSPSFPWLHGR